MIYEAIVAPVESVQPIPGADRIVLAEIAQTHIVVSATVKPGDRGLYFPTGSAITPEFAIANNLYRNKEGGGGLFELNGRVRMIRLRGVTSDGFWCPLTYLDAMAKESPGTAARVLRDGDRISTYKGKLFCTRYTPKQAIAAARSHGKTTKSLLDRLVSSWYEFPRHTDTASFRHVRPEDLQIPVGATVTITEKLHGTSQRVGICEVSRTLNLPSWVPLWLQRWIPIRKTTEFVIGTRNVVLPTKNIWKHVPAFRQVHMRQLSELLHVGEIVYGEIVGLDGEAFVMPSHAIPKDLRDIRTQYGARMDYRYGQVSGSAFYVYRIMQPNPYYHGMPSELSYDDMVARCRQLHLNPVPVLHQFVYDGTQDIREIAKAYVHGPSTLDPTHIREGVVISIEVTSYNRTHITRFKWVNDEFLLLQDHARSDGQTDIEEVESLR